MTRDGSAFPAWLAPLLLRAMATAAVAAAGFRAVSDDDFARLVIAQEFAIAPRLDPSGTSWLPFPFWLTGSVLSVAGTSVSVARALAFVTSLFSVWLVYVAAQWAGLGRRAAMFASCIAAVLPHAVWLGAATIPDGYSAALCLTALASSCRLDARTRLLGAVCITCATLSRYETWPVAALLCALGAFDAFVQRRRSLLLCGALCLLGPAFWFAIGVVQHDDALFFVKRVAEYRRALGRSPTDLLGAVIGYPRVLLRAEPELMATSALCLLAGVRPRLARREARVFVGAAVVLTFLVLGDVADGAPTHHPERPLLVVWLALTLWVGHTVSRPLLSKRWLWAVGATLIAMFLLRPIITRRDAFVDRSGEIAIGREAREWVQDGKLLIDSDDYAFFAVMAGFERVDQTEPVSHHDPRDRTADPWSSDGSLLTRLRAANAGWLVVPTGKIPRVTHLGTVVDQRGGYALVRLAGPRMP